MTSKCPYSHLAANRVEAARAPLPEQKSHIASASDSQGEAMRSMEIFGKICNLLLESEHDIKSLINKLTEYAAELAGAEFAGYFVNRTPDNDVESTWSLYCLVGAPIEQFEQFGEPRITRLFTQTFDGVQVVRSMDIMLDSRYGALGPHHGMPKGHLPVRSYLAVPVLKRAGGVQGALLFGHSKPGKFTSRIEHIIVNVATMVAIALDNAERLVQLQREIKSRKTAEKQFHELIENSPRIKWFRNADGSVEVYSAAWRKYTGQDDSANMAWETFIHPDDLSHAMEIRLKGEESGEAFEAEFRIRNASGEYRWHHGRVSPIKNDMGIVTGWVGTVTDIQDQKAIAERLRTSQERLDLAVRAHNIGIFDFDMMDRVLIWSDQMMKLFDIDPNDFDNSPEFWYSRVYHEDLEDHQKLVAKAIKRKSPHIEFKYRVKHRNGRLRYIAGSANIIYDGNGAPLRMVGVNYDYTDQYRAQKALLESEQRLKATYHSVGVGISEIDASGKYFRVNEAWTKITGFSVDEVQGKHFDDIMLPQDAERCGEAFKKFTEGGTEAFECEVRCAHKDGHALWLHTSTSAVRDENGKFIYAVRVIRDITERKEYQERQKLLINELNHRVKNTLATIQGIASQTIRYSPDLHEFKTRFEQRLLAISLTHNILTEESWEGAALIDIIRAELTPFHGAETLRWFVIGPSVRLKPEVVVPFGMVVHELATNAVKYGALSNADGIVNVSWTLAEDRLNFCWVETGGPEVVPPINTGFGSKLIQGLRRQMNADWSINYAPSGVECELIIPLDNMVSK